MRCGRDNQTTGAVHRQHSPSWASNIATTAAASHSACFDCSMTCSAVLYSLDRSCDCYPAAGTCCRSSDGSDSNCNCTRSSSTSHCSDDTQQQQGIHKHARSSRYTATAATPFQWLYVLLLCLSLLAVPAVATRDLHSSSSSSRTLQQFNSPNFWSQQSSSSSPATAAAAALNRSNQRYQVQLSDLQLGSSTGARGGGGGGGSSRSRGWGRRLAGHVSNLPASSSNLGSSNLGNNQWGTQAAAGRRLQAAQPGSSSGSSSGNSALTSATLQQQVIGATAGSSGSGSVGGHNANALCSATINYGASVGDASKGATAEVPIFVASFDVVVTDGQQQQQQSSGSSDWVLGWQFTAGEHIQQDRDVFGDDSYNVHLIPDDAPTGGQAQGVAVFGNGSLQELRNNEVTFNFVGRKGPKGLKPDDAPFRVAPPSHLFLNNHYCWPLLRPSSAAVNAAVGPPTAASSSNAAAAAAGSSTIHVDIHGKEAILSTGSDTVEVPVYGLDAVGSAAAGSSNEEQQQQQWPEVSRPRLSPAQMPRQLMVEYLPVEFADEEPGLFAKTLTQLYFKLSNNQPDSSDPVYLDQITLQYWFHGPQEPPTAASSSSSSNGSSAAGSSDDEGDTDAVVALGASQFRMTCSDATPVIGCSGIAWNVTTGLNNVFGARYVLNIWFPLQQQPSNGGSTMRYMLLPNATAAASSTGMLQQQQYDAEGRIIYLKPITEIEGIVVINYRRFFASINAQDDYSYEDTPIAPNSSTTAASSSSSSGGGGGSSDRARPIRRLREANPKMPAYIGTQLAWGSPPKAVKNAAAPSTAASSSSTPIGSSSSFSYRTYPPGSYCQRSPDGSLVCGVDMLYCCFGSSTLSSTAPADWQQRLLAGAIPNTAGTGSSAASARSVAAAAATAPGGGGSSSSGMQGYVIALSVTLPVVALGSALAIFVLLRWAKSEIRRKTSNGSNGDSGSAAPLAQNGHGGNPGGGLLSDRDDSSGTGASNNSWESNIHPGGRGVSKPSRFVRALLSPAAAEPVMGLLDSPETGAAANSSTWRRLGLLLCCQAAAADANNRPGQLGHSRNDTAMLNPDMPHHGGAAAASSSIEQQQQQQQRGKDTKAVQLSNLAADLGPMHGGDIAAVITADANHPWQQQQQQQQEHSSILTPEQLAFVYNTDPQQSLVWSFRHRGRTLPDAVMIRALQQCKTLLRRQQQQQQREEGGLNPHLQTLENNSSSNNNLNRSSSSSSSSSSLEEMEAADDCSPTKHATWNGRLNADAFGEDILGHLLNLQLDRDLIKQQNPSPSAPGLNPNAVNRLGSLDDLAADSAAAQSGGQGLAGASTSAGAAAAAVEAAIAAINAAITTTSSSSTAARYPQQQGLVSPRQNPAQTLGALIPSPPSTTDPQNPAPSFYKALMATGGVLKPPGGPPIPLNVDYVKELQPYLGRLVGKGGFGHVYEGLWRGRRVAVKLLTVDTDEPAVLDAFLKEVALCACLRGCDRIVKLLGACLGGVGDGSDPSSPPAAAAAAAVVVEGDRAHGGSSGSSSSIDHSMIRAAAGSPSPFSYEKDMPTTVAATTADDGQQQQQQPGQQQQQMALIMELMEGGNLAQRIYHPSKRRLTYLEILQIALDITTGLAYLHPAVVHRDLKPQNVLLDKQGRAAIADFGISRFKDPHRSYLSVTHQGGTPNYMAPELFNGTRVDEAADVYSLGCILYECLARKQPFGHLASEAKSFNVLFKIIVAVAINKERPPLPSETPPRLASLINRCWLEDPAQRPRVAALAAELRDMIQEEVSSHAEELGRIRRLSTRSKSMSMASHGSSNSPAQQQQQQQQEREGSTPWLPRTQSEGGPLYREFFGDAAAVPAATADVDTSAEGADDAGAVALPAAAAAAATGERQSPAAAAGEGQRFDDAEVYSCSAATSFKSINSYKQISPQKPAAAIASAGGSRVEAAGELVETPPVNSPPAPTAAYKLLHALLPWSKCHHIKCSDLLLTQQQQQRRYSCSDIEAPAAAAMAAAAAAALVEMSGPSGSSGGSAGSRYGGVVEWIMRKVSNSSNASSTGGSCHHDHVLSQQDHLPITAAEGLGAAAAAAGSSIVVGKATASTGPSTPARVPDRRPSLALSAISDLGPHGSSSSVGSSSGPMFQDPHRLLTRSRSSGLPDHGSGGSPMFRDLSKQVVRAQSAGADHALLLWQRQQQQQAHQGDLDSAVQQQSEATGHMAVLAPAVFSRSSSSAHFLLSPLPDVAETQSTALYATAGSSVIGSSSSSSRLGRTLPAEQQQQEGFAAVCRLAGPQQQLSADGEPAVSGGLYASANSNLGQPGDLIRSACDRSSSSSSPHCMIEGSSSMAKQPAVAHSCSTADAGSATAATGAAAPGAPGAAAAAAAAVHGHASEGGPPAGASSAPAVQRKVSFAVLPEVLGEV